MLNQIARTTTKVTGRVGTTLGRGRARPLSVVGLRLEDLEMPEVDVLNTFGTPIMPGTVIVLGNTGFHRLVIAADLG